MSTAPDPNNSLLMSYLELRRSVGVIGMSLPFVLVFGRMLFQGPGLLGSISAYYYSVMGNVFVGSLSAIGVFLWSYRGYERKDAVAGHLAAIFALGIALFPTPPETGATMIQMLIGTVHFTSAAGYFLTLAFFALVLFRKMSPTTAPTRMKLVRNMVYTMSGYAILVCLALIVLVKFLASDSPVMRFMPVLVLESVASVAFGISWFVKGEAILKDE